MVFIKLLVAGSRGIENFNLSEVVPAKTELIISGGTDGIDSLAERFADQQKISKLILRPQYSLYGKSAPLKRNEQMVDIADEILVVWDGKSRGAKYTIDYAKKTKKTLDNYYLFIKHAVRSSDGGCFISVRGENLVRRRYRGVVAG